MQRTQGEGLRRSEQEAERTVYALLPCALFVRRTGIDSGVKADTMAIAKAIAEGYYAVIPFVIVCVDGLCATVEV